MFELTKIGDICTSMEVPNGRIVMFWRPLKENTVARTELFSTVFVAGPSVIKSKQKLKLIDRIQEEDLLNMKEGETYKFAKFIQILKVQNGWFFIFSKPTPRRIGTIDMTTRVMPTKLSFTTFVPE